MHLLRELVDAVDVRPLLAIHLDVHELLVHELRGGFVFERFVCHDVAPVARGISDREQDRLAFRFARSSASGPQGYQSTGLSACCCR